MGFSSESLQAFFYFMVETALLGSSGVGKSTLINRLSGEDILATNFHYHAEPRENEVPYFLLKELKEGFLDGITGVYHTPQGYYVDEQETEKFDAQDAGRDHQENQAFAGIGVFLKI